MALEQVLYILGRQKAKIYGRVSSLLEVGTGFHPELSGRENIFLNGTILGMNKAEIKTQFNQIVEFSGVGEFLDDPVKYYSSGMYMRLAFAIAAHLQSEILIIDEVLAVGDAPFQERCLQKIKELVSDQGRSVLLVSHNLTSVKQFCTQCLWLEQGHLKQSGCGCPGSGRPRWALGPTGPGPRVRSAPGSSRRWRLEPRSPGRRARAPPPGRAGWPGPPRNDPPRGRRG